MQMFSVFITGFFISAGWLLNIFDPESLIRNGGLLLAAFIVFAQTGLFFCFFLPAGAVMFTAGVYVATGDLHQGIVWVCSLLIIASVLGNITGYWFGRKAGLLLYERKDSKFFRQDHLKAAAAFYDNYGAIALMVGLFLPITRTFAPIVAGMVKLDFRRFVLYEAIGSVLWILCFVLTGYFIGSIDLLKGYINYLIIIIIVVVTLPIVIGILRRLRKK
jgi:membrane-associated protein